MNSLDSLLKDAYKALGSTRGRELREHIEEMQSEIKRLNSALEGAGGI